MYRSGGGIEASHRIAIVACCHYFTSGNVLTFTVARLLAAGASVSKLFLSCHSFTHSSMTHRRKRTPTIGNTVMSTIIIVTIVDTNATLFHTFTCIFCLAYSEQDGPCSRHCLCRLLAGVSIGGMSGGLVHHRYELDPEQRLTANLLSEVNALHRSATVAPSWMIRQ